MKNILFTLLLIPFLGTSQAHITVGFVDIQDRMDGSTVAWSVGYTQFINRTGIGGNFRYTGFYGDNYYTGELHLKYRVIEEKLFRFELGAAGGYNFDDKDIHPLVTSKVAVRLDPGAWFSVGLENAYRDSGDWNGGGWRHETYLMFGFNLDVTRLGQRKLKKIKRFY